MSCAAFLGNIGVGGCVGSLGPAIPVLADISGSTEAGLGVLFTMRSAVAMHRFSHVPLS